MEIGAAPFQTQPRMFGRVPALAQVLIGASDAPFKEDGLVVRLAAREHQAEELMLVLPDQQSRAQLAAGADIDLCFEEEVPGSGRQEARRIQVESGPEIGTGRGSKKQAAPRLEKRPGHRE